MLVRKPAKTGHLSNQDSTDTPPQTNTITSWLWNWPEGIILHEWHISSTWRSHMLDALFHDAQCRKQIAGSWRASCVDHIFFIEKRWSHWLIIVRDSASVPLVDLWRTQSGRRVPLGTPHPSSLIGNLLSPPTNPIRRTPLIWLDGGCVIGHTCDRSRGRVLFTLHEWHISFTWSETSAPCEMKHRMTYKKGTQISFLWLLTTRIVLKLNWFVYGRKRAAFILWWVYTLPTYV
jgi:hypothetical protein